MKIDGPGPRSLVEIDGLGPIVGRQMGTKGLSYINSPTFGENSTSSSVEVLWDRKSNVWTSDLSFNLCFLYMTCWLDSYLFIHVEGELRSGFFWCLNLALACELVVRCISCWWHINRSQSLNISSLSLKMKSIWEIPMACSSSSFASCTFSSMLSKELVSLSSNASETWPSLWVVHVTSTDVVVGFYVSSSRFSMLV